MNKILYFLTGGLLLGGCSLTERTDLEVETVQEVVNILKSEFE